MKNDTVKPVYETLIFTFRGLKVMLDYNLAQLYNVPTKRLKEQVRRNAQRFPDDFMFTLRPTERDELVTNCDRLAGLIPGIRNHKIGRPNYLHKRAYKIKCIRMTYNTLHHLQTTN
jgi:hypothetical protein